mgnify:FL=1
MKKVLAVLLFVSTTTFASDYINLSVDHKDKLNSDQVNHVYKLNYGRKFDNGLVVEGRMEDETVRNPSKQEGLMQIKVEYNFNKVFGWKPYAGIAVGQKNRPSVSFPFYAPEAGIKTDIGNWQVKFNHRYRAPFDSSMEYTTTENYIQLGYRVTKNDTIAYKYGRERGDRDYDINGISWNHSF